ncbi:MAG: hypothetical protein AAGE94_18960 [Acidobacteriota bacterium]
MFEGGPILDERDAAEQAIRNNGCAWRAIGAIAGFLLGSMIWIPIVLIGAYGRRFLDYSTIYFYCAGIGTLIGVLLPSATYFVFDIVRVQIKEKLGR